MKTALILCALITSTFAGTPVLVRVTPEAFANAQKTNAQAQLPKSEAVTAPSDDVVVKNSLILHDGKNWTIVPKGAIVYLPDAMKSRVDAKPIGKLLSFSDFLTVNSGWLTTNEVNFDQAAGNESLSAERVGYWAKQDKLVIAVHQNGPTSVKVATGTQALSQR